MTSHAENGLQSRKVDGQVTVDIISSVLDGAAYVEEFIQSIQAQSHTGWRLWIRDDGSVDDTVRRVESMAATDSRICLLHRGGPRLGVAGGFGWVLERVPAESSYVMCGDQDDVWLPSKISVSLAAMQRAEAAGPGPVLVHTDMVVTDAELRPLHASLWERTGVAPEPATLRRVVVQNVTTAPTVMINRALREKIGSTPTEAIFQDWWYTLVAAATGRVIALPQATVLYRQHPANAQGVMVRAPTATSRIVGDVRGAIERTRFFRLSLAATTRQAGALLARYGPELRLDDREFLRAYSRIPELGFFRRKIAVARLRVRPEHGFWRNVGVLFRA